MTPIDPDDPRRRRDFCAYAGRRRSMGRAFKVLGANDNTGEVSNGIGPSGRIEFFRLAAGLAGGRGHGYQCRACPDGLCRRQDRI